MKNIATYQSYVISQNAALKAEIYSLSGAVNSLVLAECLGEDLVKDLKRIAVGVKGGYKSKEGRKAITAFVLDNLTDNDKIYKSKGVTYQRTRWSQFIVLRVLWRSLHKLAK